MIFSEIKPEFRDASFPKARNAVAPMLKKGEIAVLLPKNGAKMEPKNVILEKNKSRMTFRIFPKNGTY